MRMVRGLLATLAFCLAAPAGASTFFEVSKTCPVGGETFSFAELGSISTFGAMPDGMPVGSGYFPIRMPECPGNGLVMYRDFDAQEVEALQAIVEGAAYRALRGSENAYYRAYWLERQIAPRSEITTALLMRAAWDAKNFAPGGEQAMRYTSELVDALKANPATAPTFDTVAIQLRLVNALRELGRFEEAATTLAAIAITPDLGPGAEDGGEDPAAIREWLTDFRAKLDVALARRDATRNPIDMQDERSAAMRCIEPEFPEQFPDAEPLTAFEGGYCVSPALGGAVEEAREMVRDWG